MNLILHIGEGIGLAAAAGIRPLLPTILAGVLAGADVVLDFDRTDFSFLESVPFLVALAVLLVLVALVQRRQGAAVSSSGPLGSALAGVGVGLGAIMFAAVLEQHGDSAWPGLAGGAVCAVIAQAASTPFAQRVMARLDDAAAREAVTLYLDVVAVVVAALAIFAPPVSYVILVALLWLLLAARRRSGEKYAGLRVLR